jgi:hypothetical protein
MQGLIVATLKSQIYTQKGSTKYLDLIDLINAWLDTGDPKRKTNIHTEGCTKYLDLINAGLDSGNPKSKTHNTQRFC